MHFQSRRQHSTWACLVGLVVWLCGSVSAKAAEGTEAERDGNADQRFPATDFVIDVRKPPYNAKGDGQTDDTAAIQQALNDIMGLHKILYFPNGIYVVSATLHWTNKNSNQQTAYGFNWVQGQNPLKTVIRLKDDTFTDPAKPEAIMWCGGFGSADWFHNYVQDVTFDAGRGNPGAIGLQFYSNNTGAVRNVEIISQDGQGEIGLDLGHRDMNGPLLVRRVSVKGFRRGVVTARAVNSQTFEHIKLTGQTEFGLDNHGQAISIRGLTSDNAVPAVRSYGTLSLLEATLAGRDGATKLPAIVNYNGGRLWLRDITTTGYGRALADVATPDYFAALRITGADKAGSEGPEIAEYFSRARNQPVRRTREVAASDGRRDARRALGGSEDMGRRRRLWGRPDRQQGLVRRHPKGHRLGGRDRVLLRLVRRRETGHDPRQSAAVARHWCLDRLPRQVQAGFPCWRRRREGDRDRTLFAHQRRD